MPDHAKRGGRLQEGGQHARLALRDLHRSEIGEPIRINQNYGEVMSPAEREVMQMALETAEQIASADYRYWEELASLGGFERWARSRVNHIAEALRTALAQPEKIECSRSHPHENMGSHCQLRTEIARLTNENARLKAQPEPELVDMEAMAASVHDSYLTTCDALGWDVKPENRVPYAELTDDSKELDRASVRAVLHYTAPPQRKPLTDEQIEGVFFDMGQYAKVDLKAFARAIEAAHGIGDGPIIDEGAKYEELEYCPHGKPEGHTCWSCGNIEQAEMRGEL